MKKNTLQILVIFFLLISFMVVIGLEIYKFDDCKAVGHKTFYCILKLGT